MLCGLAIITLLTGLWVHEMAGDTLPLPWDDEVSFFWPAVHWAQDNSLLAPELNPDREVMWMPPGMMVALGTLFKVLPVRLGVARYASWSMLTLGYLCCMCWAVCLKRGLACAVLLSAFLLNGTFTAAGNVVRMDAWVWGMGAMGFMLLQSGRMGRWHRLGWTVLWLAPLVHPNGLYFLMAAAMAVVGCKIAAKWGKSDGAVDSSNGNWGKVIPWALLVAMAWAAYGVYAVRHEADWLTDMAFQFARKGGRAPWEGLCAWPTWGCLVLYAAFGLHALFRYPRNLWLVGWGGANLMVYVIGGEMWYEIFWETGWLWLVWLGFQMDIPLRGRWGQCATTMAMIVLFAWAGQYFLKHCFIEGPKGYVRELQWGWGMRLETEGPYISDEDRACLKVRLGEAVQQAGHPLRVEFMPAGDQLLCLDCFPESVHPFRPHFSERRADCMVIHASRYRPSWLRGEVEAAIPDEEVPFWEHDGTEQWYFVDKRETSE